MIFRRCNPIFDNLIVPVKLKHRTPSTYPLVKQHRCEKSHHFESIFPRNRISGLIVLPEGIFPIGHYLVG